MGSKCSILNDTEHNVWITHGINWQVLTPIVHFVFPVVRMVITYIYKEAREKIDDLQALIDGLLHDLRAECEKKGTDKALAVLIKPGEKYTWSGTLSLHMRVYVMNDNLQHDDRVCFTGPTAGSENVYPISQYFKKLIHQCD